MKQALSYLFNRRRIGHNNNSLQHVYKFNYKHIRFRSFPSISLADQHNSILESGCVAEKTTTLYMASRMITHKTPYSRFPFQDNP